MLARYRVRVARRAKIDLLEILNYVARDNPRAADKLEQRFTGSLSSLQHFPERFSKIREKFYTRFVYRHALVSSYRIIFRIWGRDVLVVRIIHQARLLREKMLADKV